MVLTGILVPSLNAAYCTSCIQRFPSLGASVWEALHMADVAAVQDPSAPGPRNVELLLHSVQWAEPEQERMILMLKIRLKWLDGWWVVEVRVLNQNYSPKNHIQCPSPFGGSCPL